MPQRPPPKTPDMDPEPSSHEASATSETESYSSAVTRAQSRLRKPKLAKLIRPKESKGYNSEEKTRKDALPDDDAVSPTGDPVIVNNKTEDNDKTEDDDKMEDNDKTEDDDKTGDDDKMEDDDKTEVDDCQRQSRFPNPVRSTYLGNRAELTSHHRPAIIV